MLTLPPALAALGAYPQFVCWKAEPSRDRPGKTDKFPLDWRTGRVASAHDPSIWTTFDIAAAAAPAHGGVHGHGVGFVFTAQDPFFFHDIDDCLTPDGQWSPLALSILGRFPGAAVEVSQSGRGLHIFGRTAPIGHGCKNTPLHLELYTHSRFAALTGKQAQGDAGLDCTAALHQLVADYFPHPVTSDAAGWTTEPVEGWDTSLSDDAELLRRASLSGQRTAGAAFGGGDVTFAQLWASDADALGRKWPSETGQAFDGSSADQALAGHLAFWTGKNCDRIERLMRASALVREKWDTHSTYLADTIVKACAFIRNVAQPQTQPAPGPVAPPPPPADVAAASALHANRTPREPGREYVHPHEQLGWFEGLFYMIRQNRVYDLKRDEVLERAPFDVVFGGHLFILDPGGSKTTQSPWEAYTASRVFSPVIVSDLCFRPEMPSGALVTEGPRQLVNSYVPYEPRVLAGDASPFLNHLALMLPDERDRTILLHWMARVAQTPGRKLQWWPVVQGVKGNGKSTLLALMTYLAGEDHSHLVNVEALAKTGGQFNSWIRRKTFLGLEEVKTNEKRDLLEVLKPFVTNDRLPLEGKGTNQTTGDNRANGMALTNHVDGLPIDDDERRYGVFMTGQQSKVDLARDGMTSPYFADWRDWWRGEGAYASHGANYGFAVVAGYLRSYAITAELDPARHASAPDTSTRATVVQASLGKVEQEVLDAIEEGRPGFAGGWVSSKYLDALITQMRGAAVPRAKRRDMMQSLGYDWHPVLTNGRTNAPVAPDGAKPKLYVRRGHVAEALRTAADVEKAYTAAQTPAAQTGAVVAFGRPA